MATRMKLIERCPYCVWHGVRRTHVRVPGAPFLALSKLKMLEERVAAVLESPQWRGSVTEMTRYPSGATCTIAHPSGAVMTLVEPA